VVRVEVRAFTWGLSQQVAVAQDSLIRVVPGGRGQPWRSPDMPAPPDGAGPVSETERSTRGTGAVTSFNPHTGSNLADTARVRGAPSGPVAAGTSGQGIGAGPGGRAECLWPRCGDTSGIQRGSRSAEQITVSTGTARPRFPAAGIRPAGRDRRIDRQTGRAGRSRRTSPEPGEQVTWRRTAAIARRRGGCKMRYRTATPATMPHRGRGRG
jgi:hypothetical protein